MSEVKRYGHIGCLVNASDRLCELFPDMTVYVKASYYDAAQSQLAALREELQHSECMRQIYKIDAKVYKDALTAAEQRNADGRQLLHDWKCLYEDMRWSDATTFAKTEEFLSAKPAESGASE